MARIKNRSSLLTKYTLLYEKKPKSRVFAPLAETYRKLGMLDESFRILKDGIRNHPSYTLGYIVLANCYFDIQSYEMAYNSIRPFVDKNLENITLQKLFAKTCINLGYLEEALQTFKYLLLINPKDSNIADQIKLLEDDLLVSTDYEEEIEPINQTEEHFNEDNWVQVDFNQNQTPSKKVEKAQQIDDWKVSKKSPLEDFKEELKANSLKVEEHKLDDVFFHEEYDQDSEDVILPGNNEAISGIEALEKESPIITHTLVDLYSEQGHTDKAIQILENILELHPTDEVSRKRLNELKLDLNPTQIEDLLVDTEDVIQTKHPFDELKSALENFQVEINKTSLHKLAEI